MAGRDGVDRYVKVKDTAAGNSSILLTAKEVALHKRRHPHNSILVPHDIDLMEMRAER